jgi:hypothetical protein
MENMIRILENNLNTIIIALSLILLISIIWNIVLTSQVAILRGRYKKFMRGTTGKNIEGVILEHLDSLQFNDEKFNTINARLGVIQEQLDRCIQKHSIVRYNAFNDTGSDLSYSIALMDNFDNGITITGIYGRNEFIGYSKPLEGGNSSYPLSVEEQMAISRCQKKRVNNK